ncbi:mechanosensitive ion channel family protein [Nitrogeniibacter aestuarii]|uniref:mechanosensitive ion channel family protein n=1 Tax=Nitrogeniibacter aestuarii TaxID=2815343 RepID=UPI001E32E609|nr:mechanosensitive ion channel family protein [Nitrogeniibacter aestuarii]
MNVLGFSLPPLADAFSSIELGLIVANILLLVFSRPILARLSNKPVSDEGFASKLHYFRAANVLVLMLVVFNALVLPVASHSWMTRLLAAVLVAFLGYLTAHLANFLIKRRFGKKREVNGNTVWVETYNTRLLGLLSSILLFVVVLIAEVQIMGFHSLLEAGGVIGFFGVILALTQGAWAPDIISGLVILNSRLVEEGDVIELGETDPTVATVFKTKIFHSELLNLANNHRTMISNATLRGTTIHNLSKFASAKGLREAIKLKVGYDTPQEAMQAYVDAVFTELAADKDLPVEHKAPPELRATDAGDFAVEWTVFYYTKDVRRVLSTRQRVLAALIAGARAHGIDLSTPVLHASVSPADPESANAIHAQASAQA